MTLLLRLTYQWSLYGRTPLASPPPKWCHLWKPPTLLLDVRWLFGSISWLKPWLPVYSSIVVACPVHGESCYWYKHWRYSFIRLGIRIDVNKYGGLYRANENIKLKGIKMKLLALIIPPAQWFSIGKRSCKVELQFVIFDFSPRVCISTWASILTDNSVKGLPFEINDFITRYYKEPQIEYKLLLICLVVTISHGFSFCPPIRACH